MTKAELLHFLEPFTDEMQIMVLTPDGDPEDAEAAYRIAKPTWAEIHARLTYGEGYVTIS